MTHALRVPQIDLASVLAAPTPHIDLRLDAYESSTRNFLKAVTDYKNRAITEIARRSNAHVAEKKKLGDRIQHVESETNQCKMREIELVATLEKEQEELKGAEASVAALRRQLNTIRENCASLDVEIEQYRAMVSNLRHDRDLEHKTLQSSMATTAPELLACETGLQFVVEGVGKDQLLIRFSHLHAADQQRECSIVLDVSSHQYKVPTSTPPLPTLPILLDQLNQTGDVYTFVKQVRAAFQNVS